MQILKIFITWIICTVLILLNSEKITEKHGISTEYAFMKMLIFFRMGFTYVYYVDNNKIDPMEYTVQKTTRVHIFSAYTKKDNWNCNDQFRVIKTQIKPSFKLCMIELSVKTETVPHSMLVFLRKKSWMFVDPHWLKPVLLSNLPECNLKKELCSILNVKSIQCNMPMSELWDFTNRHKLRIFGMMCIFVCE